MHQALYNEEIRTGWYHRNRPREARRRGWPCGDLPRSRIGASVVVVSGSRGWVGRRGPTLGQLFITRGSHRGDSDSLGDGGLGPIGVGMRLAPEGDHGDRTRLDQRHVGVALGTAGPAERAAAPDENADAAKEGPHPDTSRDGFVVMRGEAPLVLCAGVLGLKAAPFAISAPSRAIVKVLVRLVFAAAVPGDGVEGTA